MHLKALLLPLLLAVVPSSCTREQDRDAAFLHFNTLKDTFYNKYSGAQNHINLIKKARIIDDYSNPAWRKKMNTKLIENGKFVKHTLVLGYEAQQAVVFAQELQNELPQLKQALNVAQAAAIVGDEIDTVRLHAMEAAYNKLGSVPASIGKIIPALIRWLNPNRDLPEPEDVLPPFNTKKYIYSLALAGEKNKFWEAKLKHVSTEQYNKIQTPEYRAIARELREPDVDPAYAAIKRANSRVVLEAEVLSSQEVVMWYILDASMRDAIPSKSNRNALLNTFLPQYYPPGWPVEHVVVDKQFEIPYKRFMAMKNDPEGFGYNDMILAGSKRGQELKLAALKKAISKFRQGVAPAPGVVPVNANVNAAPVMVPANANGNPV